MSDELGPTLEPLLKLMDKHDLLELEVAREGMKIRLKKKYDGARKEIVALPGGGMPMVAGEAPSAGGGGSAASNHPGGVTIKSPMVGTFYRSSAPDNPPYVEAGDAVKAESVVCLIEAMKVFNEIKAEVEGEILECLVDSGEAVEFNQPLFIVRPN